MMSLKIERILCSNNILKKVEFGFKRTTFRKKDKIRVSLDSFRFKLNFIRIRIKFDSNWIAPTVKRNGCQKTCATYLCWGFHASYIECGIHGRVHLKCTSQEHSLVICCICICCRQLTCVVVACKRLFVVGMFTVCRESDIKCRHAYRKKTSQILYRRFVLISFVFSSLLLSLSVFVVGFCNVCMSTATSVRCMSVSSRNPLAFVVSKHGLKYCNHCLYALSVTYSKR